MIDFTISVEFAKAVATSQKSPLLLWRHFFLGSRIVLSCLRLFQKHTRKHDKGSCQASFSEWCLPLNCALLKDNCFILSISRCCLSEDNCYECVWEMEKVFIRNNSVNCVFFVFTEINNFVSLFNQKFPFHYVWNHLAAAVLIRRQGFTSSE